MEETSGFDGGVADFGFYDGNNQCREAENEGKWLFLFTSLALHGGEEVRLMWVFSLKEKVSLPPRFLEKQQEPPV